MASKDNKVYLKVLCEINTVIKPTQWNTRINNLKKLYYSTEDDLLQGYINIYCTQASGIVSDTYKKLMLSVSTQINFIENGIKLEIEKYCQRVISTNKPEWQIMAERNGWKPPVSTPVNRNQIPK